MSISDEKYYINGYIVHELPNGDIVIQHRNGIVNIVDKNIKKFIKDFEGKAGTIIKKADIKYLLKCNQEQIFEFLIKNEVLKHLKNTNFNIKGINFVSNCKIVNELLSRAFEDRSDHWKSYNDNFTAFFDAIEKNNKELFIVFLNPYNKKLAKKIRDLFKKSENTYSITCYIYNNRLYIESIYSAQWKSPCHQCQMGLIEAEHRLGIHQEITYQQIVDVLYQEDNRFEIEFKLEFSDAISIASQIINRLDKLFGLQNRDFVELEDFTEGIVMDIKTKKVYIGTTHHWELCDCYE